MNQGPAGLQPDALPLSYIPAMLLNLLIKQFSQITYSGFQYMEEGEERGRKKRQEETKRDNFVRNGVRTHALIRGPEISCPLPIRKQGINLESGALDHSAILTLSD